MRLFSKIIPYEALENWRNSLDSSRQPLVVTNGCFDILHIGHIRLLESARELGNTLLVGLTGDAAVRALKGQDRPLIPEEERAQMLASLESVSTVCVFSDLNAVNFLKKARPDKYIKGADYSIDTINIQERLLLEELKTPIQFIPHFDGRSTSALVARLQAKREY